jgi:hypothetical protein
VGNVSKVESYVDWLERRVVYLERELIIAQSNVGTQLPLFDRLQLPEESLPVGPFDVGRVPADGAEAHEARELDDLCLGRTLDVDG